MSRRDRSTKHLALASHFESLADDELTPVVAAHYVEAHRCAPEGKAGLIAVNARDWLTCAGKRALSLGSPEQALALFEQALEMTTAGAERAALLEDAGEAANRSSNHDHAVLLLKDAIAYYEAAGDMNAIGHATVGLAHVLLEISRLSVAAERCERIFDALGDFGDEKVRSKLAYMSARAHSLAGSSERALEWSETALVLAERLDDPTVLGEAIDARAGALFGLGRHQEAVMLFRGRVGLADSTGALIEQASARLLVSVCISDDDPREALSTAIEAAELAETRRVQKTRSCEPDECCRGGPVPRRLERKSSCDH